MGITNVWASSRNNLPLTIKSVHRLNQSRRPMKNKFYVSLMMVPVLLISAVVYSPTSFAAATAADPPTCGPLNQQLSSSIMGLAMDPSGNLYVSDEGNSVIRKYNYLSNYSESIYAGQMDQNSPYAGLKGTWTRAETVTVNQLGDGGAATSALLNQPRKLQWNNFDNSLFLLDFQHESIRRIDETGNITTIFTMPLYNYGSPRTGTYANNKIQSFAINSSTGDIYIGMVPSTYSASYGGQIVKIPSNYASLLTPQSSSTGYGAVATNLLVGSPGSSPGSLSGVNSMAVANNGTVYVSAAQTLANSSAGAIVAISTSGVVTKLYNFTGPVSTSTIWDLTFDDSNNLWATVQPPASAPFQIVKFDASGLNSYETPTVMVNGSGSGLLATTPTNSSWMRLAVNSLKGGIFVSDNPTASIMQIGSLTSLDQTISYVAGIKSSPGSMCMPGNPISVTQSLGGSISPGSTLVLPGPGAPPLGYQIFTFTPSTSTGYAVSSVTVDGISLSAITTPTLESVITSGYRYTYAFPDTAHTISATFAIPPKTIAVYSGLNGDIKINGVIPSVETTTVTGGSSQAFTFSPSSGYSVESITIDGTLLSASTTPTLASAKSSGITIAKIGKNYTVAATFALTTYAVTVSQGSNGTISPASVTLTPGVNQLFTFTPSTNYSVASITIDGSALSGSALTSAISSGYEFLTVATDHTVAATYTLITYVTTVTQGSNGTISPGTTPVGSGSNQAFTFIPATNYSVASITIDGTPLSASTTPTLASAISSGYTFSTVTAVHTVTATYALITFVITVTQGSNGTIAPSSTTAGSGTNQAFTFTPSTGYSVASITIDGIVLSGSALTSAISSGYTFSTLSAVHTVAATYSLITYAITVTQGSNGTISPGTTTAGSGSSQTFTFTPSTNYSVASITIDGIALSGSALTSAISSGYTFSTVVAVHAVAATYSLITYAITVTQASNGTISPGTTQVGSGSSHAFTFTSSTGYSVASITIDGTALSGSALTSAISSGYTFSTVAAAHTVAATWTHNEYAVTFYKNNVSATGTMAVESKTAATALTANSFALVNNVFLSWNTTETGTGTSYSDSQSYLFIISASLYAQWGSVITYSTLGADSGTPSKSSDKWSSGVVSLPTEGEMKKAGYSLGGWSDGATTYTETYTPTSGITLNPVWTPKTYTVRFNKNGANSGTVPSDQTWDESVTALTLSGNINLLVKHGYTFGGWAVSASSRIVVTTFSSISDTLTHARYAIWTPVSYSVSYVLNGGTSSVDLIESSHTINETFTVATAIPVRDTYVFGGWSNGSTVYPSGASYTVETSTITLTAQWIAQFTVHYIMNGSTSPKDDDALYPSGTAITTAAAPSRTGYIFNYWLANNSLTPAAIESFTVIANSNLTATWTAIDYSVTYAINGGSSTAPTHAAVNINDIFYLDSANPIKAGYLFTAWSDGTNIYGAGASYAVGSVDIILTAQWTAISYKVTYNLGGGVGTLPSHANVNLTDAFTVSTEVDPTWLAHTFAGWSDGTNSYTKIATYTTGSSNITLTAIWTLNGYTQITYALGGGSGALPRQDALLEGSSFDVASGTGLTKDGQAFNGWNDATNTYQLNEIYVVGSYTAPIVLTAQWAIGYSVTYSADTATVTGTLPTDSVLRIASATFTLSSGSTLIRSGYTFAGWSNGGITSLGGTSQTIGSADVIYTAEWTLIVVALPSAESRPVRKMEVVPAVVVPVVIVVVKLTPGTEGTSPIVAAQIAVIKDQSEAKALFTSIPSPAGNTASQSDSSPRASQINILDALTSINTKSATTNSLETANFKLPAKNIVLSDLVVKLLELQVKLVATDSGFSVTPVAGFTGVLVIPIVATIDGVQVTVLNRVVVNPVSPVAIGFTPKSIKESAISWAPSTSQVVAYVVEVNGKTLCQTTSSSCPVPTLIGPNSKVTISALGNDQTLSAPEVIPYVAKAPIPALSVAFALNSSRLSSAQKSELRRIAKIIDKEGFTRLVVSGFTDSQGSTAANKVLSAARAKATAAFLTQLLPELTVKTSANGAKKPVKAGKSATAFEANRRSEIRVW
jgi:uncharacterized repeat protein (TIGR02543 family)